MNKMIGENIRALRNQHNLTMSQLADILGLSHSYIGLVERGERGLSQSNLVKMCKIFGVTLDDLVLGKEHGNKTEQTQTDSLTFFFNEVLCAEERKALIDICKSIIPYHLKEKELRLLCNTVDFQIKQITMLKGR